MRRSLIALIVFAVGGYILYQPTAAYAQATRTWVSGVGDDANPCSRTAPCKTFAGAISKTAPGGEIDALDPGGFGAVTITKSITLDGGGGQVASVLVAGTNGIVVAAQPTDIVIIRNLRLQGLLGNGSSAGNAGLSGISFISGAFLLVENTVIDGFNTSGINVSLGASATLNVVNTTIKNIGTCSPASCVNGQGDGIFLKTTSGNVYGELDHSTIEKVSNNGIESSAGAIFTATNSNILNAAGNGLNANGAGNTLDIDSSSVSNNNTAFKTTGGTIRVTRNVIYDNNNNFSIATGTIASAGNNMVAVNGATTPNGTVTQQ